MDTRCRATPTLTAQMIQERFNDLLSDSENQSQNKVNPQNSKKKTSTNRIIKRLIEVLSLGRVVSLDRLKRDPHI